MNKYEEFALGNFLSQWPEGKTFTEVLEMIEKEHEDILIWEPFECHDPEFVIEQIENMIISLEREFITKENV